MTLTSVEGQKNLPRYFHQVFALCQNIKSGQLDFEMPDGRVFRVQGAKPGPVAFLKLNDPDIFATLIREGDLGFSEAYLDQAWETPDLQAFMDFVHADNWDLYDGFPGMGLVRTWEKLRFWFQSNSKTQARKNISYHYDLGNDFYEKWLDETMTYSSALFQSGDNSLEQAQRAKYAAMVDGMGAQPGDHVLEIGCGWGGFAEYAAKERGLHVTGLTISQEQFNYAKERIEKAGLSEKVTLKLQDYRDETGLYDGIASIEMFEAVGQKYWPIYFDKVKSCLKPGKNATLQIITVQDARWDVYQKSVDFIQKYIFPGGMLPSPLVLRDEVRKSGLTVVNSVEFGKSYSQTLRIWHETFNDRWAEIEQMGFDDRFRRMWNFYLTSCAATFESGNCDVTQITIQKPA